MGMDLTFVEIDQMESSGLSTCFLQPLQQSFGSRHGFGILAVGQIVARPTIPVARRMHHPMQRSHADLHLAASLCRLPCRTCYFGDGVSNAMNAVVGRCPFARLRYESNRPLTFRLVSTRMPRRYIRTGSALMRTGAAAIATRNGGKAARRRNSDSIGYRGGRPESDRC